MIKRHRLVLAIFLCVSTIPSSAFALTNPQSNTIGLEGAISSAPPSSAPTISLPANNSSFSSSPISISGLCSKNLVIRVYDNGVFVGSSICNNGTYSLLIPLFNGLNKIQVLQYDALNQASPPSQTITVNYSSAQFLQFGTQITITSPYAEKGAQPGTELDWPISINGGTPPYALSIDWGDSSSNDLRSITSAGSEIIKHTYSAAGVYTIILRATDKNGETGFLQLVGQATGQINSINNNTNNQPKVEKELVWWPALAILPLLGISFIIGSQHRLQKIRYNVSKAEEKYSNSDNNNR